MTNSLRDKPKRAKSHTFVPTRWWCRIIPEQAKCPCSIGESKRYSRTLVLWGAPCCAPAVGWQREGGTSGTAVFCASKPRGVDILGRVCNKDAMPTFCLVAHLGSALFALTFLWPGPSGMRCPCVKKCKWTQVATQPLPPGGSPLLHRGGGRIRSGPQVGKVATQPLPPWGSPPLQSGGHNQKWPTSGQGGYITPAALGIPTASKRGARSQVAHKWAAALGIPTAAKRRAESQVAHKWARWLYSPCHLGDPHLLRAGGGGENQRWCTSGQGGYITPAAWGIPTASERGAKSEGAHKWARWLHNPCPLGDAHRFRAGGRIRIGPQVGKVAT